MPRLFDKCPPSPRAKLRWLKLRLDEAKTSARTALKFDDEQGYPADYFLELAGCAAPAWEFVTQLVSLKDIDRREGLIGGPLYTSSKHPWPRSSQVFDTPIIQIWLSDASQTSGLPLGDGLLQVWGSDEGDIIKIRIIPSLDVLDDYMEPPYLLDKLNYDAELEAGDRARPRWISEGAIQILDYCEPSLAIPYYVMFNPALDIAECLRMNGHYRKAKRVLKIEAIKDSFQDIFSTFLFGTFDRNTYGPDEKPPTLLSIGSGYPFWFSENGELQVFFEFDTDGDPSFTADWSIMT